MKIIKKILISLLVIIATFIVVYNVRIRDMHTENKLIVIPKLAVSDTTDEDNHHDSKYNDAVSLYENKKYVESAELLKKIVSSDSGFAQVHFLLGKIHEIQSYYSLMGKEYEKYLALRPEGLHANYAKLRLSQHYIRTALSSLDHKAVLELMKKAETYLKTLDQKDESVKLALAVVYINKNESKDDYRDIIEKFENSEGNTPIDKTIKYNVLGLAYVKVKEYDNARKMFETAIADDPNNKYAYNNLGYAYTKLGKYEVARHQFIKALELDSNYSNAKKNLEWVESEIEKRNK